MEYLTPSDTKKSFKGIEKPDQKEKAKESKKASIFENVEFSLDWLNKAQKELNRRD